MRGAGGICIYYEKNPIYFAMRYGRFARSVCTVPD